MVGSSNECKMINLTKITQIEKAAVHDNIYVILGENEGVRGFGITCLLGEKQRHL